MLSGVLDLAELNLALLSSIGLAAHLKCYNPLMNGRCSMCLLSNKGLVLGVDQLRLTRHK